MFAVAMLVADDRFDAAAVQRLLDLQPLRTAHGDGFLERNQLRTTLPIRRVVRPADVAALAVHIMTNTALTGATYDIDGGQQLVEKVRRVNKNIGAFTALSVTRGTRV